MGKKKEEISIRSSAAEYRRVEFCNAWRKIWEEEKLMEVYFCKKYMDEFRRGTK